MVKVETLKEDGFVRILRCREDNRIWYQMWLTDLEKGCIDRYFLDMEVKAWWLINLQRGYVFFYEKNGRRVNLSWVFLCEHVGMWDSGYPLIRGAKISWYSKGSTVPLNLTFENKK